MVTRDNPFLRGVSCYRSLDRFATRPIDYDDARDPDTERIHPTVCEHIERAGSYADISTSGTGIHILLRGELPEGVKAIEAALPDHSEFPDAEIEVYDSGRFVAMTGEHIRATPRETTAAQGSLMTSPTSTRPLRRGRPTNSCATRRTPAPNSPMSKRPPRFRRSLTRFNTLAPATFAFVRR